MNRRRALLITLATSLFVVIGYYGFWPRTTVWQVERQFDAALPVGTPKATVVAWLQEHYPNYHGIRSSDAPDRDAGFGVFIPASARWDLFPSEIRVSLMLDDNDQLATRSVTAFSYWP